MKAGIRRTVLLVGIPALIVLAAFTTYWHTAAPRDTCVRCHEIQPSHDMWMQSAHRNTRCEACHGTAISNGFHSLWENSRRAVRHFSEDRHDDIRLNEEQVVEMVERCKGCHGREFAAWLSSGHSMRYADFLLNEEHNRTEQINADCLRCHGMFFEGRIEELVQPIATKGPWKMVVAEHGENPAIPCLVCHEIHKTGRPAAPPDYAKPKIAALKRPVRPVPVSFYDRNEARHFEAGILPRPRIADQAGELVVSADPVQRLCVQCHANVPNQPVGLGDDRTPRGVHEGLSCSSCHAAHSMETRGSCQRCHPKLSNCGLDVEKMNTSYLDPESAQNIHFVACADCHQAGVPKKRLTTDD